MTMSHQEAVEKRLAERYLLGEMSEAEAGEFELHYFECQPCAVAVESGSVFIDNAKSVMRDAKSVDVPHRESSDSLWKTFLRWFERHPFLVPVPVALAFAALAIYQHSLLVTNQETARPLPAFQLIGAARGETPKVIVPATAPDFELSFDVPPDAQYPQFDDVVSKDGTTAFRVTSPAPGLGQPISILIPTKQLQPGEYKLEVLGKAADGRESSAIAAYTFVFQSK